MKRHPPFLHQEHHVSSSKKGSIPLTPLPSMAFLTPQNTHANVEMSWAQVGQQVATCEMALTALVPLINNVKRPEIKNNVAFRANDALMILNRLQPKLQQLAGVIGQVKSQLSTLSGNIDFNFENQGNHLMLSFQMITALQDWLDMYNNLVIPDIEALIVLFREVSGENFNFFQHLSMVS